MGISWFWGFTNSMPIVSLKLVAKKLRARQYKSVIWRHQNNTIHAAYIHLSRRNASAPWAKSGWLLNLVNWEGKGVDEKVLDLLEPNETTREPRRKRVTIVDDHDRRLGMHYRGLDRPYNKPRQVAATDVQDILQLIAPLRAPPAPAWVSRLGMTRHRLREECVLIWKSYESRCCKLGQLNDLSFELVGVIKFVCAATRWGGKSRALGNQTTCQRTDCWGASEGAARRDLVEAAERRL
jgi:hypothetical protein